MYLIKDYSKKIRIKEFKRYGKYLFDKNFTKYIFEIVNSVEKSLIVSLCVDDISLKFLF